MFQQYLSNLALLVKSGYKSNTFSPLVWFCAIVMPVLAALLIFSNDKVIIYTSLALFVVLLMFCMRMYLKTFDKDPKLLQSERFRIEDKKLDLVAQKGSNIEIEPFDLSVPPQNLE